MRFWIYSQEHAAWWKPNWQGYTRDFVQAGTYSLEDTRKILGGANFAREKGVRVNEYAILVSPAFTEIPDNVLSIGKETDS
jgi:hypothetical protein